MKICFIGAGSTVFAKNLLGDVMLTPSLCDCEIALYDIDEVRLRESYEILDVINVNQNESRAKIKEFLGVENRKEALRNSDFVITAIQVGGYEPSTVIDFEIPKKFGLQQTIADTLGIGGIFRALRTIPVFQDIANDMEEVCKDAWLLNYVNPMGIITGYMQRYTNVKTIGLCHSVQVCAPDLLKSLDMEYEDVRTKIAGINHMGWLTEIKDKDGNDLYPEIRKRAFEKNKTKHYDMVRFEYINRFGYYCTESSEHNAEYNPYFIKSKYPELIEKYNIPIDEYPRRCVDQMERWSKLKEKVKNEPHNKSKEYAASIMDAIYNDNLYTIGGNVINDNFYIENLPKDACIELECLVSKHGITPLHYGKLPVQLAAMNMTNVNVQLLTIEAARTLKKEHIYHAAMLDPHTSAELSIDDIVALCDELIAAHGDMLPKFE